MAEQAKWLYIDGNGQARINGDKRFSFDLPNEWNIGELEYSFLQACTEYDLEAPLDDEKLHRILRDAIKSYGKRTVEDNKTEQENQSTSEAAKLTHNELRYAIAQDLMTQYHFCTMRDTLEIYVYNISEGIYVPEQGLIREAIELKLGSEATPSAKKCIIEHIQDSTPTDRSGFDSDIKMLHFNDCWLDYTTGKTYAHSADRLSIAKLPFNYDPRATAEPFDRFLDEVLYPEEKDAMLDAMAYTFYREHVADIINILVGVGANGKSVLAYVLEKLHGDAMVSHKSLKDIMTNRFARAGLEGKNLNFTIETAKVSYADTAILKEITSNGVQDLERKGIQSYQRRLWAKIWTATNVFPDFDDESDGMTRRLNIFDFPNQFEGDREDPELKNKLTTPEILAGIMNMLVPRIKRIAETKRVIMAQKSIAERRRAVKLARNPLLAFEDDCLREPTAAEIPTREEPVKDSELKSDVYQAFLTWCTLNKVPKMSEDTFGRAMKNVLNKRDARISISGRREWFWQGVKLNDIVKLTLSPKL